MNAVPIDEGAVHRELDALEAGTSSAPPGAGPLEPEPAPPPPPPMDWTIVAGSLVFLLDRIVAPNWALTIDEQGALHENFKVTLSAFFPTLNIDPRVQAVLVLCGTLATITAARYDFASGKLTPLRAAPPADDGQSELQFGGAQARATT